MSVSLSEVQLFIVNNKEKLFHIKISQNQASVFNLETIAEQYPIHIHLLLMDSKNLIIIRVNNKFAQFNPNPRELNNFQQYKLLLQNRQLIKGMITSNDDYALTFKFRHIANPITNNTKMLSNSQSVKYKLYSIEKGTCEYQSTASLRHSISEVSFSQASRFAKEAHLTQLKKIIYLILLEVEVKLVLVINLNKLHMDMFQKMQN